MSAARKKQGRNAQRELLEALRTVDRPVAVCTSGERPLTMPGLVVAGLGTVRLPLGKSQARKLIGLCHHAPYGKGTKTVVDTDVRRVWELDSAQFELTNTKWDDFIQSLLADVQQDLGIENQKLNAQLYKLLLYEAGSFFLPHRDGEKIDRMIATLVVGLPAQHEGGELIVRHEGREYEVVFAGAASGHELSYAAFYADCQHEVLPVRSGYRLCLTYNVTLAASRSKKWLTAPRYGATIERLTDSLDQWKELGSPQKLAVILDHRYTQKGLILENLKGVDRAQAELLFAAARQTECAAYLALVTLWQLGSAEAHFDYPRGYGRRYYRSEMDDESDWGCDRKEAEYEMGEVYEDSLSANHWSDRDGNRVHFGEIPVLEEEIVAVQALDETAPNSEEFEGYTGNAGMTLERWYHRAAVVIWPRTRHFHVLSSAGTAAAIGGLETMVTHLRRAAKSRREAERQECLSFASAIIDDWQPVSGYAWNETDRSNRSIFPQLICELDDIDLMRTFLSRVVSIDSTVKFDGKFATFCKHVGWNRLESELIQVIDSTTATSIGRNARLLRILAGRRDKSAERVSLCLCLAERAVAALQRIDAGSANSVHDWRTREIDRVDVLSELVTALLAVHAETLLSQLIAHVLACDKYELTDVQVSTIFALKRRLVKVPRKNAAITHWISACRNRLQFRVDHPPQKPTDFRRDADVPCACRDCRELCEFLADPGKESARFPLPKERRRHVHNVIDANHLDCTHVTERCGRPYTLVCTKTTASFEAACQVHKRDQENLSRLEDLDRQRP